MTKFTGGDEDLSRKVEINIHITGPFMRIFSVLSIKLFNFVDRSFPASDPSFLVLYLCTHRFVNDHQAGLKLIFVIL